MQNTPSRWRFTPGQRCLGAHKHHWERGLHTWAGGFLGSFQGFCDFSGWCLDPKGRHLLASRRSLRLTGGHQLSSCSDWRDQPFYQSNFLTSISGYVWRRSGFGEIIPQRTRACKELRPKWRVEEGNRGAQAPTSTPLPNLALFHGTVNSFNKCVTEYIISPVT